MANFPPYRFRHPYTGVTVELEQEFFFRPCASLHDTWDREEVETLEHIADGFVVARRQLGDLHRDANFLQNFSNVNHAIDFFWSIIADKFEFSPNADEEEEIRRRYGFLIGLKQAVREGYGFDRTMGWMDLPETEEKQEFRRFIAAEALRLLSS
jgi:hypothetical protein